MKCQKREKGPNQSSEGVWVTVIRVHCNAGILIEVFTHAHIHVGVCVCVCVHIKVINGIH